MSIQRKNEAIKWRENIKHFTYKERTIVCNYNNGQWLKTSEECFNLLDTFIKDAYTYAEILEVFEDTSDQTHFTELIERLFTMGALLWKSEKDDSNRIKTAHFCVTDRCNLSCIHCCADAQGVSGSDALNTTDIKKIIDKFIDWDIETIIFTGGEPLVRDDFLEILQYTRSNFTGHITLMTNATLIDEYKAKVIATCVDSIDISLDGYDKESCEKVRGNGVFSKVINSIKLIQQEGVDKISLSMVRRKGDDSGEAKFRTLCSKLSVKPMIRIFADIGRGENSAKYFLRNSSMIEFQKDLSDPVVLEKKRKNIQNNIRTSACSGSKTMLYIDSRGDIYPCPLLVDKKYNLANIADISHTQEVQQNLSLTQFTNLFPENIAHCKDCDVQAFCITCYELVDRHTRKKTLEKYCAEKQKFLYDIIWNTE